MELKLFFSWQTETNLQGFKNKNFLIRCIEAAIKNAEKKDGLQGVTIELHEGLRGIAGNSKVSEQMFQQIDECDIFVGDVTTVQRLAERGEIIRNKKCLYFRYSPNCNVYGEYNRALGKSKTFWKQIILVMNEANKSVFDDPDVIPFDTRDTRWPIVFKLEDDSDESKTNAKDELVKALTTAIHRSALEALKSRNTRFEPFITWNIHTEDGRIKNLKIADSVMGKYVPVINGSDDLICILGTNEYEKAKLVHDAITEISHRNNYIYADIFEEDLQDCKKILNKLSEQLPSAIVVIDNISGEDIVKVVGIRKKLNLSNKFIFLVKEDVRKTVDISGLGITFVDITTDLIDAIDIKLRQIGFMSSDARERVKLFCDNKLSLVEGYAKNIHGSIDYSSLSDENITTFVIGSGNGEFERTIMQSLSLFECIGWSDERKSELEFILTNKNITPLDMDEQVLVNKARTLISQYINRGLIEERGRTITITPQSIALQLATEWFNNVDAERFLDVLNDIKQSMYDRVLTREFHDRFKYLASSDAAKSVVEKTLKVGSIFEKKEVYNSEEGAKLLDAFVQVNPESVTQMLNRVLSSLSICELKQLIEGRRYIVWTLEKLCFRQESFKLAAHMMMRLALAENENISNNATGVFVSLFPIRLPATEASLDKRLDFLKESLKHSENKGLIIRALGRALTVRDFILFRGSEVMGDTKVEPYMPKSKDEDARYLKGCLELVMHEIEESSSHKPKCLEILESSVISICDSGWGGIILPSIYHYVTESKEDWDNMQHTLSFFKKRVWVTLSEKERNLYQAIINCLTKEDYLSRFKRIEKEVFYIEDDQSFESKIANQQKRYENLANNIIEDEALTPDLLKNLISVDAISSNPFGATLAKGMAREEQVDFVHLYVKLLNDAEDSRIDILCNFISVIEDDIFESIIPVLQTARVSFTLFAAMGLRGIKPGDELFDLLNQRVANGLSSVDDFLQYWTRIRLDQITEESIMGLFSVVLAIDGGFAVMVRMGAFMAFGDNMKQYPNVIDFIEGAFVQYSGKIPMLKIQNALHVASSLLSNGDRPNLAKRITEEIVKFITDPSVSFYHNYEIEEVCRLMMAKYFEVIWPPLANVMLANNADYHIYSNIKHLLGVDMINEKLPAILLGDNYDKLLEWCETRKNAAPAWLASLITIADGDKFSKEALLLIDRFGDCPNVLSEIGCNLDSFSSWGSVVPHYEQRKKIYSSVLEHEKECVRLWARKCVSTCEYIIQEELKREREKW